MELQGHIKLIGQTESIGANGFTKRQLVVETQEQYPQQIPIDFVKDKTSVLDSYKIGDEVKVSINIRGNEYNGKYYVNLQGWRIEKLALLTAPANNSPASPSQVFEPATNVNEDGHDDLPF